jgi:hypothetical protein
MNQQAQFQKVPRYGWLLLIILSPFLLALVVVFLAAHLIARISL